MVIRVCKCGGITTVMGIGLLDLVSLVQDRSERQCEMVVLSKGRAALGCVMCKLAIQLQEVR